ncbi:MAG: hypothetical protein ABI550_08580 [Ignavibacteriaceae bacterium]
MIQSKSIRVLKTFSEEELKQFSDFLRSPFHNKNKNLIKLFNILEKYHSQYEVENEIVYSKVYPGKKYNYDNLKKLMSELFLILEMFLSHLKLKKEKFTSDKYLLEEYVQRKLNELFLFKVKKVNEKLEAKNCYNIGFEDKFYLECLIKDFYIDNNMVFTIPLDRLIRKSEYLLCFFLENMLTDINDIISLRGLGRNKFKQSLITESFLQSLDIKIFLEYLSHNKIKNNYIVFLINSILMLMYPKNETYFNQAKHLILNNYDYIYKENPKEFSGYFLILANYCGKMSKRGKTEFNLEGFELYKHYLKVLSESFDKGENTMQSLFYLNLIMKGITVNELDWVEEFIRNYTKYLEQKDRENTYNYANALLNFKKEKYEKSLSYLSKIPLKSNNYPNLEINLATLKCYFELALYDAAFSLIDSSKHYLLTTNEFDYKAKEYFMKSLIIMYKLFKLKIKVYSDDTLKIELSKLKSKITYGMAVSRKWCLAKIEELEKSIPVKIITNSQDRLK